MIKEHKDLIQCNVEDLPERIIELYKEEFDIRSKDVTSKLRGRPIDKFLKKDCSYSFAWTKSKMGSFFWHSVWEGRWDDSYDKPIDVDKLTSEVFNLINKVNR
jgi:hypothetical protein